jgi:membrane associated rhomboid family serine protease
MFPLHDNIRSHRFPFVNYAIIVLNFLVFFKELQLAHVNQLDSFMSTFALIPARLMQDPVLHIQNIVTAMFLHGGWGHVIGNMWFLHVFGDNVEDNLGHVRYLFFYLLMGFGAAATQIAASPHSQLPMVGASGAIAGVLGAYIVLYPGARVLTFFVFIFFVRFIEVPAFFFLGLWFLVQALNGVGSLSVSAARGDVGGVAWWAHAGGFAAGFLSIPFFRRKRR